MGVGPGHLRWLKAGDSVTIDVALSEPAELELDGRLPEGVVVVGLPRGKLDRFSLSPVIADDEASFAFRGKATSAAFLPPGDYEAFFLETKDPFHTPSVRLLAAQGGLALKAHQRQRLRFGRLRSGGRSELRGTLQAALLAGLELAAIRSSGPLFWPPRRAIQGGSSSEAYASLVQLSPLAQAESIGAQRGSGPS